MRFQWMLIVVHIIFYILAIILVSLVRDSVVFHLISIGCIFSTCFMMDASGACDASSSKVSVTPGSSSPSTPDSTLTSMVGHASDETSSGEEVFFSPKTSLDPVSPPSIPADRESIAEFYPSNTELSEWKKKISRDFWAQIKLEYRSEIDNGELSVGQFRNEKVESLFDLNNPEKTKLELDWIQKCVNERIKLHPWETDSTNPFSKRIRLFMEQEIYNQKLDTQSGNSSRARHSSHSACLTVPLSDDNNQLGLRTGEGIS